MSNLSHIPEDSATISYFSDVHQCNLLQFKCYDFLVLNNPSVELVKYIMTCYSSVLCFMPTLSPIHSFALEYTEFQICIPQTV